jgi:fibronectin type 3 domain-containing protein
MRRFLLPSFFLLLCLSSACGSGLGITSTASSGTSAADHVVDLSWTASNSGNIAGYNVYRSPDGNSWSKINVSLVGSTLYDDSTVLNGDTYFYAVTAVNLEGDESGKSSIAKAVIP